MKNFLGATLVAVCTFAMLPAAQATASAIASPTPGPDNIYAGEGPQPASTSAFAGITADQQESVQEATPTGCWISVNNPFQLYATEKAIHGQGWITHCTSGVSDCRVEVDMLKNSTTVASSAAYYGCSINTRREVKYACTHHPQDTYDYKTRGYLSVLINGQWYVNAADSGVVKYWCV